jgi:hypothetical protein
VIVFVLKCVGGKVLAEDLETMRAFGEFARFDAACCGVIVNCVRWDELDQEHAAFRAETTRLVRSHGGLPGVAVEFVDLQGRDVRDSLQSAKGAPLRAHATQFICTIRPGPVGLKTGGSLDSSGRIAPANLQEQLAAQRAENQAKLEATRAEAERERLALLHRVQNGLVYEIAPKHRQDIRVDVRYQGQGDGTTIWLWPANGTEAQRFVAADNGDGTWTFRPRCALHGTIDDGGISSRHCHLWGHIQGNKNQRFVLETAGDGWYVVRCARDRSCVWDVSRRGGEQSELLNWPFHGGLNQVFRFTRI